MIPCKYLSNNPGSSQNCCNDSVAAFGLMAYHYKLGCTMSDLLSFLFSEYMLVVLALLQDP